MHSLRVNLFSKFIQYNCALTATIVAGNLKSLPREARGAGAKRQPAPEPPALSTVEARRARKAEGKLKGLPNEARGKIKPKPAAVIVDDGDKSRPKKCKNKTIPDAARGVVKPNPSLNVDEESNGRRRQPRSEREVAAVQEYLQKQKRCHRERRKNVPRPAAAGWVGPNDDNGDLGLTFDDYAIESSINCAPVQVPARGTDGGGELARTVLYDDKNRADRLPEGWEQKEDPQDGRVYYVDHNTQTTHWELPSPPADGWIQKMLQVTDQIQKRVHKLKASELESKPVERGSKCIGPASNVSSLEW